MISFRSKKIQGISSDGLRKVAVNMTWLFIDRIGRMGIGLVLTVLLARHIGPKEFGIWSYVIAFTALFSALAGLGLDGIVVRELVRRPEDEGKILGSSFFLRLIAGVFSFIVSLIVIRFIRPGDVYILKLTALSVAVFIFQSTDVIDYYFQARMQQKYVVIARNSAFFGIGIIKIIIIINKMGLMAFVWASFIESIIAGILLIITYSHKTNSLSRVKIDRMMMHALLKDSWPLIFAGVVVVIYMKISQIIVTSILGDYTAGIYSSAVRLSEIWYFIPMVISNALFPAIVRSRESDHTIYKERLQHFYDLMVWLSVGIALPVTFMGDWIVLKVFGRQFIEAGAALSIQIWGAVFVFLGVASSQFLMAENLIKLSFIRTGIGAVFNVALNLTLIPKFGIKGAASATLLSYIVATFGMGLDRRARWNVQLMLKAFNPLRILTIFYNHKRNN